MVTGKQMIATEWSMIALTFFLVCLRNYLRFCRKGVVAAPEFFTLLAWVFFTGQAGMDTVLYQLGHFHGKINPAAKVFGPEVGLATYEDTVVALKIMYAETVMYYCTMYSVKAAMLFFFYEIIPKSMPRLRLALNVTTGITVVGWASSMLLKIFACQPISANWAAGDAIFCSNITSRLTNGWQWGWHVLTDILIYVLPIFLVRSLQLPLAAKLGVAFTFALGFVCLAFANIVMVSFTLSSDPAPLAWLYSVLEQTWAIIVVCLPAFKALITQDIRTAFHRFTGSNPRSVGSRAGEVFSPQHSAFGGRSKLGIQVKIASMRSGKFAQKTDNETALDDQFISLEQDVDIERRSSVPSKFSRSEKSDEGSSNTLTIFREMEIGVDYEDNIDSKSRRQSRHAF